MKRIPIFCLLSFFSYAENPPMPIEFLGMSTAVTIMPTIIPTYVTVQHFNTPPFTILI